MAKKAPVEGLNILGKAWSEVKKINWHEVNRLCQQNFHIGLVGSEQEISAMRDWLGSFPYVLANQCAKIGVKPEAKESAQYVTAIAPTEEGGFDEKLIKSTTFCLAGAELANEIRRLKGDVYVFDQADSRRLTTQILSNHDDVQFALAHNFPVFRPELAQSVIQDTAFQNAAWALLTGLPNSLPGPHHILTTPFEGISDFAVLTLNQIKLMFELVGLSGYRVSPLYHIVEFATIVGLGKLAESAATNIIGKVAGRTGILAKGAIAYAFTWTIGETIFFYHSTGHRIDNETFIARFRHHHGRGKKVAAAMIH